MVGEVRNKAILTPVAVEVEVEVGVELGNKTKVKSGQLGNMSGNDI